MICQIQSGLKYYQFEKLSKWGIQHGFFTRHGGVSPAPFDSLNMATTVGDSAENVLENLRRMFSVFDLDLQSRYDGWQTHSTTTIYAEHPRDAYARALRADALMTDKRDVTLVMRFGDCVPVILYDHQIHIIAVYHAGWQGTVKQIGKKVIQDMKNIFGCQPEDIFAGIGPSIGPDHFEVRDDVAKPFQQVFGAQSADLLLQREEKTFIDLWKANCLTLMQCGVNDIECMQICTVCHREDWFSHRGDYGKTGRFGVLVSMAGAA